MSGADRQLITDITPAILAGGRGSRMGYTEKGLMQVYGMAQYLHQYHVLSQYFEQVLLSIREDQADKFTTSNRLSIVLDQYPECGPMGGILSCLQHSSKAILAVSTDLIQIEPLALHTLLQYRLIEKPGTIFLDNESGYLQPLFAIYEMESQKIFKSAIQSGDYSLHRYIRKYDFHIVPVNRSEWFRNINTLEDLTKR